MIGKTISHYKIIEKLGEGGMGVLYKAVDTRLNRNVALKFLPPHLQEDEDSRKRFIQEAKAASSLEHPNICSIYEIDDTPDGQTFIVMPCYEGQTLRERLEAGPLEPDQAIDIACQVASGLAGAHERGIVHRDIKPGNIFITRQGLVKILDFGLAKLAGQSRVTKTGTTVGTVLYMSPEQVKGEEAGHRNDIWSLGVMMYEMLAGHVPFTGDYEPAIMYSILNVDPEPLPESAHGEELNPIVLKMLEKNPDNRYLDVDELLGDLRPIATRSGIAITVWKKPRSMRPLTHMIISAAAILAITLGYVYLKYTKAPEPAVAERKSVAVMPFENLTGDPAYDVWTRGLQELITTGLSGSKELKLFDSQAMQDALRGIGEVQASVISFPVAQEVALQVGAGTLLMGNVMKSGDRLRLQAKLQDSNSGELLMSKRIEGWSEDDFFAMADSVTAMVKDFMEIEVLKAERPSHIPDFEGDVAGTASSEAYRHYILGMDARYYFEWDAAIRQLEKAVELDSSFVQAALELSHSHINKGDAKTGIQVWNRLLADVDADTLPPKARYLYKTSHASLEKRIHDVIYYHGKLLEMNPLSPSNWQWYGYYYSVLEQHEKAVEMSEKALELYIQRNDFRMLIPALTFWHFGRSLFKLERHERAVEVLGLGLEKIKLPFAVACMQFWLEANHLAMGNSARAKESEDAFFSAQGKDSPWPLMWHTYLYVELGDLDRAMSIYGDIEARFPEYWPATGSIAYHLIDKEIDVSGGLKLVREITETYPDAVEIPVHMPPWSTDILHQDLHHTMGWGYYKQGEYEKAVELLEIAWDKVWFWDNTTREHLDLALAALREEASQRANQ